MSIPTTADCETIHKQYRLLTGIDAEYTMSCRFVWECFLARKYTESDLACVVRYLKERIRQKRREKESLTMRNLVGNLDYFSETLSMARAAARNTHTPTPRERILASVGMSKPQPERVQPVGDIIAGSNAFEKFREAMKAEGLL